MNLELENFLVNDIKEPKDENELNGIARFFPVKDKKEKDENLLLVSCKRENPGDAPYDSGKCQRDRKLLDQGQAH